MVRQLVLAVAFSVLLLHTSAQQDFIRPRKGLDNKTRAEDPGSSNEGGNLPFGRGDLSPTGPSRPESTDVPKWDSLPRTTRTVLIEYINISVVNPDAPTVPGSTVVTNGTVRFDGQEVWGMGKATIMFLVDKNRWWQFSQGESFIGDDAVLLQGNVYVDNGKLTGRRALVGGIGKYAHATGYEDIEIDLGTGNGKGYLKLTM